MDELIVEKIESHLFEYGYKFQNNTYTKDDHNIQISPEINNIITMNIQLIMKRLLAVNCA